MYEFIWTLVLLALGVCLARSQDVPVSCGGFIKADFPVDFTKIKIKLYSAGGTLKESSDCAPNIGYFLLPLYDKGEFSLVVDGPEGWKTEPSQVTVVVDGETDVCSRGEDINFKLLGFSVLGQVVSDGLSYGPSGVSLELKLADTTPHTTVSSEQGRFVFEGVPPGQYSLSASHPLWSLSKRPVEVVVSDGSFQVPANSVTVEGFNVEGRVGSDGEPIPGVKFLLYSKQGKKVDCEPYKDSVGDSNSPACVAVSNSVGVFTFPKLPPGQYSLVPQYVQNGIDFKVYPTEAEFIVVNDTVTVEPSFEVHGFSVSGKVLRLIGGEGLSGARVLVDGEPETVTDSHGNYHLLNITTGRYNIKIDSEDSMIEFVEVQVYLSPSDPVIPTITPAKYGVCGHVKITNLPQSLKKGSSRSVQVLSPPSVVLDTIALDIQSKFCTLLPLGEYTLKVVVTESERAAGLEILPLVRELDMSSTPPSSGDLLTFTQFTAEVTGEVTCLDACGTSIEIALQRSSTKGQELSAKVSSIGKLKNKAKFSFSNVLPGKVKVSVSSNDWCWEARDIELVVTTEPVDKLSFKQTGYSMPYTLSHDLVLVYSIGNSTSQTTLSKGDGKLCLKSPGVYTVQPQSCHKFGEDRYFFDIRNPKPLVLEAQGHYVNVSVLAPTKGQVVSVTVSSSRPNSKRQVLEPINAARLTSSETETWKYSFSFLGQPGGEVEVTPVSTELMFSPTSRIVTVSNDCPEEVPSFIGTTGLIVRGGVEPAIEGVVISVQTEDDGLVTTTTNVRGQYEAGPLRGLTQLSVSAQKEDYVFEPLENDPQSFKALKLSKIVIKVVSTDGEPLSTVLVSLSGANFRSNNFTTQDGILTYSKLNPGQYFIKPLLREHEFIPGSKVVDLVQGDSEEIVFTGNRVAFSCSGKVTTLNRYPLEEVMVKAQGQGEGDCGSYVVEAPTDSSGDYRLRGLMPSCQYSVAVMCGDEIDRTLPTSKRITVTNNDVEGVDFVGVMRANNMYITGNVVTDNKYFSTLKAVLSSDGSAIQSASVDKAGFFDFPPVAIQNEAFLVLLDTSLSSHSYNITRTEGVVSGSHDSHITLRFTAEEYPPTPESQRGSVIALLIAVFIIFALVNIDKLFGIAQGLLDSNSRESSSLASNETRRKTNRKR